MYISVAEAQGQLLDLVRRAEAGEEVLLTHEGKVVGKIDAVAPAERTWRQMTPDERLKVIQEIVAKAPPKPEGEPDAAHSQDFLYDENGLPA
jgi:antitoxin (DNA-binding transcriptional repressor) of toxin-antitoxin stability system